MSKIAFLSLMQSGFISPRTEEFFKGKEKSLFCHTKGVDTGSALVESRRIKNIYPTHWGTYSLLSATSNLLKESLEGDFTHFCLISESHLPLCTFEEAEEKLCVARSLFDPSCIDLDEIKRRALQRGMTKVFKPLIQFDVMRHCSQWFVLNRNDAEILVDKIPQYRKFYSRAILVDEIIPASILLRQGVEIDYGPVCYTSWKETSKKYLDLVTRSQPRTFFKVKKIFLDKLREMGYTFMRKVHPQTTYEI